MYRVSIDDIWEAPKPATIANNGGTVRSVRHAKCCQFISPNSFLNGFPDLSQFTEAVVYPLP